jgi:hypothetical protein
VRIFDTYVGQACRCRTDDENRQPIMKLVSATTQLICQHDDRESEPQRRKTGGIAKLKQINRGITQVCAADTGDRNAGPIARPNGRNDLEVHESVLQLSSQGFGRERRLNMFAGILPLH